MHVPDGILPITTCIAGYATTAALTGYALRKIGQQRDPRAAIPRASLLAAAFFVASWVHIPVPPVSVHLILNCLLGAVLGYFAIPAILVGLFFQAIMFGHGGLTTFGVNATIMGAPALLAWLVVRGFRLQATTSRAWVWGAGFLAGVVGVGLATLLFAGVLVLSIPATLDAATERAAIVALSVAHLPVMLIEGIMTALVLGFLHRVSPAMLGIPPTGSTEPSPVTGQPAVPER
jgi:cobalt/nickel transport system permease protein